MTFGLSGAAIAGIATAAGGIGSALIGANSASNASNAQAGAAQAGIAEQDKQFEALKALLAPYNSAGTSSLNSLQNLIGINGNGAQGDAINQIKNSSQFDALNKTGQDAILQNASATGGLRGGNVQGALAQFSPQLLNQLINQQYSRLSGITSLGENAASMTGNAGIQTGQANAGLLQQQGAAIAGGNLAQGKALQTGINSIVGGLGTFQGLGGATNPVNDNSNNIFNDLFKTAGGF